MQSRLSENSEAHCQTVSAIREALKNSGYYGLRRLICEFDGAVFAIRGRVSTFYEKQVAQQIVLAHLGGRICIDNQRRSSRTNRPGIHSSTSSKRL